MAKPFLYFDLGNVIALFDHEIACRNVAALTGVDARRVRQIIFQGGLEDRYERGDLSTAEFHQAFCEQSGTSPSLPELQFACSDIFRLNVGLVPIIASLKAAGYRLGILSNTCPAHWDFLYSDRRYRILGNDLFDVYALSYELHTMKPEPTIYRLAAEIAGVEPSDIFFIDDRADNVAAACSAGYDAVQFVGRRSFEIALQQRNLTGNY